MEKVNIGIDIGGMSIKGGVVNRDGEILFKKVIETDCKKGSDYFINSLCILVEQLIDAIKNKDLEVQGIGIGVPGVVNNETLSIDYAPNLNMEHVSLAKLESFNTKLSISNDANCAALAEQKFGSGKNYPNVVFLTIGTGVGGGVVINNKLYEGVQGKGAELGHSVIIMGGRKCGCGRKGCFEAYASARSLVRYAKNEMKKDKNSIMWELANNNLKKVNGVVIFEAAKKHDSAALKALDTYIMYLGEGLMNYNNIFRPNAFVIGGGISAQKEFLIDKLKDYVAKRDYGFKNTDPVEILAASLGNDAGIIGAASLVEYE